MYHDLKWDEYLKYLELYKKAFYLLKTNKLSIRQQVCQQTVRLGNLRIKYDRVGIIGCEH